MKFKDLRIGMTDSMTKSFTEKDVLQFAKISADMNPLHIDEEAAKNGLFGKRVAHGILVSGLISAVLGTKLPGEGTIYLGQELRFRKPVFLDDVITAKVEVVELIEEKSMAILNTTCINQNGETVITGKATVLVKQ